MALPEVGAVGDIRGVAALLVSAEDADDTAVPVVALKPVIHGLPLVPPVNPSQSNRSWVPLGRVVQFRPVTGRSLLAG
jgi:hypothetical protein